MDERVLVAPLVALLAGSGWLTGAAGRVLLGRIPRGVLPRRYRCECGVAALWTVAAVLYGLGALPWRWLPAVLVLSVFAVLLVVSDLAARRLPDALTVPAYPVLGGAAVFAEPAAWPRILAAAAVLGGAHLVVRVLAPRAMGGGDVKLAGALGLLLGARGWPATLLFAPLAAVVTVALAVRRGHRAVPHGPGLLAAGWVLVAL